jgi:hypothetical protein
MSKKTLDTWGGVGCIAAGFVCIYFASLHSYHESIWKVWIVFSVLLVGNGIAMFVHAKRRGGLPGVAQDLMEKASGEVKKAHV